MSKFPSHPHREKRSLPQALKEGALGTALGAGVGCGIGFSLTTSLVLWGWGGASLVALAFVAGALLVEGVHRKW